MKVGLILLLLGFGVLSLPAFLGAPQPAMQIVAPPPPAQSPATTTLSQRQALENCETVAAAAAPEGLKAQFSQDQGASRPLGGGGRFVKVAFTAKNARNIDLQFYAACQVWPNGRTELVSMVEVAGRDLLASTLSTGRVDYLQSAKITKLLVDASHISGIIANRNEFPIKNVELTCRLSYGDAPRHDDRSVKVTRVIPPGGTAPFQILRTTNAASAKCRIVDYFKVNLDEQRLVDAFGPAGAQSSHSRLRQDAIRLGVAVDMLVGPYIAMAKALSDYRH